MLPSELAALFEAADLDLGALLEQADAEPPEAPPTPSLELVTLSRRLSGQYVDLLAHFTRRAHAEQGSAQLTEPVVSALTALIRLNDAVDDQDLSTALTALLLQLQEGFPQQPLARTRFLDTLRAHILAIADLLDEADGQRLRTLIEFEQASEPLLDALGRIHGIGPRRLERLYCAGLFTIEPITTTTPEEISSVTSIPLHLCAEIIRTARTFAERRRRSSVADLQQQVQAFIHTLPQLDPSRDRDRELIAGAMQALGALQHALGQLSKEPT